MKKMVNGIEVECNAIEAADIQNEWSSYTPDYKLLRRSAYPPIGDQLDAYFKYFNSLPRQGFPLELSDILDEIEAVKIKYPPNNQNKE